MLQKLTLAGHTAPFQEVVRSDEAYRRTMGDTSLRSLPTIPAIFVSTSVSAAWPAFPCLILSDWTHDEHVLGYLDTSRLVSCWPPDFAP